MLYAKRLTQNAIKYLCLMLQTLGVTALSRQHIDAIFIELPGPMK